MRRSRSAASVAAFIALAFGVSYQAAADDPCWSKFEYVKNVPCTNKALTNCAASNLVRFPPDPVVRWSPQYAVLEILTEPTRPACTSRP